MPNYNEINFQKLIFLRSFYTRWTQKAKSHDSMLSKEYYTQDDETKKLYENAIFDKFFTLFVCYNALYNTASEILGKATQGDHYQATSGVIAFFEKKEIILLSKLPETVIDDFINKLRYFYIHKYSYGKPYKNRTDRKTSVNLDNELREKAREKGDEKNRTHAVLEILYLIRCNMFHGQKMISYDQLDMLKCAACIITDLNKALYETIMAHNKIQD
jgi:hypothetical protein